MISGLIDKLRQFSDGQVTYREARAVMLQAADTIWQLRDDLQRANAENAKLREQVAEACRQLGGAWVRCVELGELVQFANKTVEGLCEMVENSPGCFMCPLNQDEDRACGAAELFSRMRELGVGE